MRDEKERNIEYVITLKEFIQHLKYEINEKNKDICYKNDLLKKSNMTSNEFNKAEVETSLQSSFARVTQKSKVFGNNDGSSSSIHDNQISQGDNEISIILDGTNGTCYSNRESDYGNSSINQHKFNEISMLDIPTCSLDLSTSILSNVTDTGVANTCSISNTCRISNFLEFSVLDSSLNFNIDESKNEPFTTLKKIRIYFINQLIIAQLNINSLRNKFEALKHIVSGNPDILVVTESKLDASFPVNQFRMDGYSPPYRVDRTINGGGVIIYIRDDIPCTLLSAHPSTINLEGIFLEINLNKS